MHLLLLAALAATPDPGLAVMDFAAQGASPELAAAVSATVSQKLSTLGVFRISSADTTRLVLGMERQKQLLGCESCSGAALGEMSSFEFVVTGKVMKAAGKGSSSYSVILTLLAATSPQPLSTARAEAANEAALLEETQAAAVKLVGKLLEGRQGHLVVQASEVGAAVKVDDTQVGTTPLDAPIALGAGPHLVSVEKDGFSRNRKEVRVVQEQVAEEYVRLVPSPDTILGYEVKATRMRVLAWSALGVGVVAGGVFGIAQSEAARLYGSATVSGSFEFNRAQLIAGNESVRTLAGQQKAQIETMQAVSVVGLGFCLAGLASSAVLFITQDPPGKYDAYRSKKGVAVSLAPAPGGVVMAGSF
jgi:hypothetical protein